jgi:Zn-dependent protease
MTGPGDGADPAPPGEAPERAASPPPPAGRPHPGWVPPPGYGQHPGTWYPPPEAVHAGAPPPGAGHPGAWVPPPGTPNPQGTWYPPPEAVHAGAPPPGWYPPAPGALPAGQGYAPPGWRGWGQGPPASPGQGRPQSQSRRSGAAGGLLAALIAFLKYGLAFGKFGFTFLSMLLALVAYALLFGWQFGAGIVILIFIHEMGHFLVSRALGVPMSAPVFIPFLGAFTQAGAGFQRSRSTEAVIAAAGPLFGFVATLAVFLWAELQPVITTAVAFAYALSYFGFFITPAVPFDGGRVASAISRWVNVVGLVIFGAILLAMMAGLTEFNPFLLLFFAVACYSVWNRFKAARQGREAPPLPVRTRVAIGTAYVSLVALSALFMSLANSAIDALVHGATKL